MVVVGCDGRGGGVDDRNDDCDDDGDDNGIEADDQEETCKKMRARELTKQKRFVYVAKIPCRSGRRSLKLLISAWFARWRCITHEAAGGCNTCNECSRMRSNRRGHPGYRGRPQRYAERALS